MAENTAQPEPIGRLGWWESTVTDHAEVRAAIQSALTRTCDVDEDTGVPPVLSFPRCGRAGDLTALTASFAQLPIRANTRGWELTAHPSLESRRMDGWVREATDAAEELLASKVERLMLHVTGPWTFGAEVEFRGHPVLRDRPAFKDCALHLGFGVEQVAGALSAALGCEVIIALHEPRVREVMGGLPGATRFDTIPAVDREFIYGVWQRFQQQVARPVVLDTGSFIDDALSHAPGFHRIVVPADQLQTTSGKDLVGGMIGRGQGIGWAVSQAAPSVGGETAGGRGHTVGHPEPAGVESAGDPAEDLSGADVEAAEGNIARAVLSQWTQWTLPADELPGLVDIVVPERKRTAAQASVAAARARHAAALLWRN